MSNYQVLARRWRPQAFTELVGQDHVATTLINAMRSDRMPHALLFTGARGVGKTSAARILAKSLRCPNAKDFVPCHECHDCTEIAAGRSMDVIEIDGASNNSVDNIRELRETVGYMPSSGKYKVYIIDEVHMLSTSAFNALLKTLEEPPPHVVFIFATTEVQKIPVTILSRCQRFDFRRIPIRKVVEHLQKIAQAENVTADSEALWLIARESEGSMRDSQSLLDQVMSFCGAKITYQQVVDVLGLTDRTILSDMLKALVAQQPPRCLELIEKIFNLGYDPVQFAQDLLEHIRNLMVTKVALDAGQAPQMDLPDQELEELATLSKTLSSEDIHLLFDMTLKGVSDVLRSQNPRLVLEMLLIRLAQAPRLSSIETLIEAMSSGSGSGGGEPRPQATKAPQVTATPVSEPPRKAAATAPVSPQVPAATLEPVTMTTAPEAKPESWAAVVDQIKKQKPLLGAKLEYAAADTFSDSEVVLSFQKEQEFIFSQVASPEAKNQLSLLIGQITGKACKLEVKLGQAPLAGMMKPVPAATLSPIAEKQKQEKEVQTEIRKKVESHPLVLEMKNALKGQITQIKELT